MTKLVLIFLLIPIVSIGQIDTLIDLRDGKVYRTTNIAGTDWMLDNLDYQANFSVGLTDEQKSGYEDFNLHGRYYHFLTIDSVCPSGWRLPHVQDWTNYYNYLVSKSPRKVKLQIMEFYNDDDGYYTSFMNYSKRIDMFQKGNPLNLNPTGRIEGEKFNIPDVYADYFAADSKETFKRRSHIHIMNAWTTIHSHQHNMQPEKTEELRKFMVRCVSTDN